tara:strand:- start:1151 stop:2104 length:954 start_codon:yes stop_codon:yes gene_type:complete
MNLKINIIFRYFSFFLFVAILNAYSIGNNNSIFQVAKDARSNSLSGMHLLSSNVSGVFAQPINLNHNIRGDSYFSYLSFFDNSVKVLQVAFCLKSNEKNNISFGIINRKIDDISNTQIAWSYSDYGPSFNNIDYSSISSFSDNEIGFLISISSRFKSLFSFNLKLKPLYHKLYSNFAYGFGTDLIVAREFKKFNLILGLENLLSFKKWDNGTEEIYQPSIYLNSSYNFNQKLFIFIESDNHSNFKYGIEHKFRKFLFIRCGYNNQQDLSLGAGIDTEVVNFNYSYVQYKDLDIPQFKQYSLTFKFNGLRNLYKDLKI